MTLLIEQIFLGTQVEIIIKHITWLTVDKWSAGHDTLKIFVHSSVTATE